MNEQRIIQALHESAEQAIPADLDLWPTIQARLQPQQRPSRWMRLIPTTRLGWALLILALFLALGAAAYTVDPAVSKLFQQMVGLRHVEQTKLVQELDLTQTIDGVTVTLQRAYADTNQIVVGYTIKSSDGQRYDAYQATLTDAAGTVFSQTVGMGVTGHSDLLNVNLPPGEGAMVVSFDAMPIQGTPWVVQLRLAIKAEKFVLHTPAPQPPAMRPGPSPNSNVGIVQPESIGPIIGPFTLDFSIPFIPGRVVQVQQTVEKSGIAVRLERVVVTPSETRAILCLKTPSGEPMHWTPVVGLAAMGKSSHADAISGGSEIGESGCYRYSVFFSYYDQPGEWTLTVKEVVDLTQPGKQTRLSGPWVFRFHVP